MADSQQGRSRLTRRQAEILDYICQSVQLRGFPPSIREIGEAVGLSSSSTVHSHLRSLEEKHYIKRNPSKPRSVEIIDWPKNQASQIVEVPVKTSEEQSQSKKLSLPVELVDNGSSFLYKINSDIYKQDAIMPGDLLIVNTAQSSKEGDMVLTRSVSGNQKELCKYKTKNEQDSELLGKVIGVIRKI